ncbi:leucine--tRNA ligase [Patescibacteria group bacterium]|nr:leucine--tRNA ligase [Patescibacteria group bacterium]MBU1730296.1 leucine--tRNA ligase [Patescibacteria group bacterium]MBU1956460.1 leucine--tRNA ligase [Patescibacteria group bacterium]
MQKYKPEKIEKKWQDYWEEQGIYKTSDDGENSVVKDGVKKEKFYLLDMFPYPSGDGLHMGHTEEYVATDIYARYLRMNQKNVLYPTGWDAFGLPTENYAIKTGVHPKIVTKKHTDNFRRQLKSLGVSYDWSREIDSSSPEYYKWTQWFFLLLYKNNLAYKKKAKVNWCESCQTVLANEQAEGGICERCKKEVAQKDLEQWFFKITDFADDLINGLDQVDWPSSTVTNQRNWIGRSEGTMVRFEIALAPQGRTSSVASSSSRNDLFPQALEVFTTRVDTLFSCSFLILAPDNLLVETITTDEHKKEVEKYVQETRKKTNLERTDLQKDKKGVFTGAYAINPANNEKIPIWISDFVLADYGTGAVFADAHDERDFEFAQKYNIPLKVSIRPQDDELWQKVKNLEECFSGDGILINSEQFDGLTSSEARTKITDWLIENNLGDKKINYKLRDWLISRQRYWGAPIPVVYDPEGTAHPIPEKYLPWLLPTDVEFKPTGVSPLAKSKEFFERTEKIFGKGWTPEIDTMDTFVCSSWYYFRFADPKNDKEFAGAEAIKQWLPIDMYVGGAEHTVLHLMYARFFTKVLHKLGLINFNEPFTKLHHQGTILAEDGRKMSKSLGNVINPDDVVKQFGTDTLRLHIMFLGSFEDKKPWSSKTILGPRRFLEKVWQLFEKISDDYKDKQKDNETLLHKTIKKVSEDIQSLDYNTAISAMMILVSDMEKRGGVSKNAYSTLLQLLAPFAPHISEELWNQLGNTNSIFLQKWPKYDETKIKITNVTIVIQINGKVRDRIIIPIDIEEKEIIKIALACPIIQNFVGTKKIQRTIYIKNKLINIVI